MDLQQIQQRLRAAIKNSGIKQKDIARHIGVSAKTVSTYMKADIFPALDTVAKRCALLNVSADFILGISKEV